jgi:penicillin amidase
MSQTKNQWKTLGLVLSAVAGAAGAGYYLLFRRPLAVTKGDVQLRGLSGPADIYRDKWGVAHIYAAEIKDALFAQGYVHAQDRLWQMEFNRRMVAGRLSEVLGKASLPLDRWMRILSMRRTAEAEVALLSPETRDFLEAYAAGINARIRQGRLPVEFTLLRHKPEPWVLADSLSWAKMMAWTLSVNWETELLRARLVDLLGPEKAAELEPDYGSEQPTIVPPGVDYSAIGMEALRRAQAARAFTGPAAGEGLGSNNWVISGERTVTGKPLLANDMHLLLTLPAIWYENHLEAGPLHISGVSFPGIPGIIAGHNANLAWGFTNGFPDVQDLYMEHLRRQDDGRVMYEYQGEWLEADLRREVIQVKGDDPAVEEVVTTRHGPVINTLNPDFIGETPLALRWTALDPSTIFNGLFKMNLADDCLAFREALRDWDVPVQNIVYADIQGNIGYSFPGKVPVRARGDGRLPVPGWSGEYEWTGFIPFEELPHLYNPPQGYIVTANNRVVDDDYPHWFGLDHASGHRAQRIHELIQSKEKISFEDIRHMHFDQLSTHARAVAAHLGCLETDDPELSNVVKWMAVWDGSLGSESPAAAIYQVFTRRLIHLLLAEKLGPLAERYEGQGPVPVLQEGSLMGARAWEWIQYLLDQPESDWFDLGGGETREQVMRLALRQTWGKLHKLTFSHVLGQAPPLDRLFNRGPYPLGGDTNTVWATGSSLTDLDVDQVVGPPFRFIADLGNLENCQGLLAPGQSGQPSSRHYDDQIQAWFKAGYHSMYFSRQAVEKNAVSRLRLAPIA